MNAVEKWYEVMKSNNLDLLDNLLADDVIFYSPVVFTPQKGKELTKMYLMAAEGVFGSNQNQDIYDMFCEDDHCVQSMKISWGMPYENLGMKNLCIYNDLFIFYTKSWSKN